MKRFPEVMMTLSVGVLTLCAGARSAAAQVGYTPATSPYVDVDQTQEITPLFGYFRAKHDPAKVAPQGGLLAGVQYEWRATGPLHLGFDLIAVNSNRTPLDPSQASAARRLAGTSEPLFASDGFLAVSLPGERSWHHLMPMVTLGFGFVSDFRGPDVGGFKTGTRFAFPWGAGIRWVPGSGHIQLRADVRDWMYTVVYPQSYYVTSTTDPPILTSVVTRSRWTNNFAMTVGVSYIYSH